VYYNHQQKKTALEAVESSRNLSDHESRPLKPRLNIPKLILETFESIPVMIFILCVVIAASTVAIYQFTTGVEGVAYTFAEYIVFAIFAGDVTARAVTHTIVRKYLSTFVFDRLNQIDILVVVIDIIIFAANSEYTPARYVYDIFTIA
jgi:hypothetical protein